MALSLQGGEAHYLTHCRVVPSRDYQGGQIIRGPPCGGWGVVSAVML